jgi:HK97 family phage major capsid protein
MSDTITTPLDDRFTSREELVQFIETQTTEAVQKALPAPIDRRVPYVTSGPIGRDSAGYSVLKAAAYALGYVGPDQAKEELHVHQQLREVYKAHGFLPHCGHQAFLVPFSTHHLPAFEPRAERLREELKQKMVVDAPKFDPDEAVWIEKRLGYRGKALSTLNELAGGSLVSTPMLGELIDLQRNLEAFSQAGAQEVSLPPNGRMQFPKLTGGSTAYWVGEGNAITESNPTTGYLDLQAKKLGILVKLNNELLRFASPSAEGLLRRDMARQAALKADLAMLLGTGGTQIKGLLTYAGITSHTASTEGDDGDTFEVEDLGLMEGKLPDAVQAPSAWLMRKELFSSLTNRRADAITAGDQAGPFLFQPGRRAGETPAPELYGTKVVRSSQISNTRIKGDGVDLTYTVLGYFPDWIIARLGVMEFLASGMGDTALQNDQTYLRGIQHLDAGPRHEASFVWCDHLVSG